MNYNQLALRVLSSNPMNSDLDDSISICSYVSDCFGIELDVEQGKLLLSAVNKVGRGKSARGHKHATTKNKRW